MNNLKIAVTAFESTITRNNGTKSKRIEKKKIKLLLRREINAHFEITHTNGELLITLLEIETNRSHTLFSDTYTFESDDPMFGFSVFEATTPKSLSFYNFKMQYYPYVPKGIRIVENADNFGEKENLGKNINTQISEYAQTISADGNLLVYTHDSGRNAVPYFSKLVDENWTEGKPFSESLFPDDSINSIISITADRNTFFSEW